MNDQHRELREKILKLDKQIEEQKRRIPPHSVQPSQIIELERLEEEREILQKKLGSLEGSQKTSR